MWKLTCVAGARYLDDCPVKRYIPIYLIVGGVFAFCEFLSGFVRSLCNLRDPDSERTGFSKFCKVADTLIGCFTVAWFIAGELSLSVCLFVCVFVCVCSCPRSQGKHKKKPIVTFVDISARHVNFCTRFTRLLNSTLFTLPASFI